MDSNRSCSVKQCHQLQSESVEHGFSSSFVYSHSETQEENRGIIHAFYAPNFEEVEGAYWFGSVRPVQSSPVQWCAVVCSGVQSVMRE